MNRNDIHAIAIQRLSEGKTFATVQWTNGLIVDGYTVVNGQSGRFVGRPQEKGKDGRWHDRVFFLSQEDNNDLATLILEAVDSHSPIFIVNSEVRPFLREDLRNARIRRGPWGKTLALVELLMANGLITKGFRVVSGSNGLFVSFPSRKDSEGNYHRIVDCQPSESTGLISDSILEAYSSGEDDFPFHPEPETSTLAPSEPQPQKKRRPLPRYFIDYMDPPSHCETVPPKKKGGKKWC